MIKQINPEVAATFNALGFTPIDPAEVMTDWWPQPPAPEHEVPATFYHAGIDAYFAYAPDVIDGMWDAELQMLRAIAVIDEELSPESWKPVSDLPLQLITVKDLPDFVAQHAFSPAYFDLRIAKQCVTHAHQELSDLGGDSRPTRAQFRLARKKWKEAVKHWRSLVVPRYQSVTRALLMKPAAGAQSALCGAAL